MLKTKNNSIYINEVGIKEIAEKYGTPTYVYDEQRIRKNYRRAYNAFSKYYPNFKFFYAVKANNNPAIVNVLRQEGAGVDAASINEILLAKKVGIKNDDIIFTGNYLSDDDIKQGLEHKVIINLDDISMIPRVLKYGVPEIISFRVNPGYGKSNVGSYGTIGGPEAKFGVHPEMVTEAYRQAKNSGIKRFGIHMMPGSCITDADYFSHITSLLMNIMTSTAKELNINFEFLDIGGGLGIPYAPDEESLDIEKTARLVVDTIEKALNKNNIDRPKLIMEPGRYFLGDAGYVIGKVHTIKKSYSKIIGTDIGMNAFLRPAFFDAYHDVFFDGREQDGREKSGLCGQLCENTDYWIKERDFPKTVQEGDLLVVLNAGAYGYSMSYQFNGRLRPAEVLVEGGKSFLIRKREDFQDMIKDTLIPDYLIKN